MAMTRGVGYCTNGECEDYAKGVFLLNHGPTFYCPRCHIVGDAEMEYGQVSGDHNFFREVRVEHNYCNVSKRYRDVGIVMDVSLTPEYSVYTLFSPLIKTEKRALKVAEAILANLNRTGRAAVDHLTAIPSSTEILLSFDDSSEEFQRKLQEWANSRVDLEFK